MKQSTHDRVEDHFAAREKKLRQQIRHLRGQLVLRNRELAAVITVRHAYRREIAQRTGRHYSHLP